MNHVQTKAPIDGEILSPSDSVSIFGTTHPLNAVAASRIHLRVTAGLSIAEILQLALRDKPDVDLGNLIVRLGDHEIPRANWNRTRVKKNTVLTFTPRLAGNSPVLRTVLSVAITVAAVIAAPYLAPEAITIGGITIAASVAQSVVALGIVPCGDVCLSLFGDN